MSALLIYKQRHLAPNKTMTSCKNQAHIAYIATRPGVVKDSDKQCGLFGSLYGAPKNYISSYDGIAEAKAISDKGITMFRSIISFTEEQAKSLGLNSLSDWQEYVRQQMPTIAKANGIKMESLNWCAAVHQKAGHPHVHIAFWDTSPNQVQRQFTKTQVIKNLRAEIIKNTYPELLQNLYDKKSIALDELKNAFADVLDNIEPQIAADRSLLCYEVEPEYSNDINISVSDLNQKYITNGFVRIMNMLPESGSLKYQLLPPEIKSELETYVITILNNNEKLKQLFDHYIGSKLDISECYTESETKLNADKDKYTKESISMLCNMILKEMKSVLLQDGGGNGEVINDNICLSILNVFVDLNRLTSDNNAAAQKLNAALSSGDLSALAKKEMLKKLKDKGIGVEY